MKKILLAAGAVLAPSSSFTVNVAENDKPQYLSDWWYQSVNVVGSYHTRFGPQIRSDAYPRYEASTKKGWFDSYGYVDASIFFDGNSDAKGIWNHGPPLFMEIEPYFSIDKLTSTDLSFGPFEEQYFANNYIYDMGRNKDGRQSIWHMGLGIDIDTSLPVNLSMNVYAKYQQQNYGTANGSEWDSYRFKIGYPVPIIDLWGGQLSYIGFTSFDQGSDLGDDSGNAINGIKTRTNNFVASSHILALNYDHWRYSAIARYWHDGGQWNDDAELNFGNDNSNVHSTGQGGYLVVGYDF